MKIVKYIFLLIVLLFIALTVFIATQEGKYDIRKERVIKVPKTVLYNYINDYRNWENVGILTDNDTTAVFSYSENAVGKGAKTTWKVKGSEGELRTIRIIEHDSIIQKAVIDGQSSDIEWAFKNTAGGTLVTVHMKGELSFMDKAYAVLKGGVEDGLGDTLANGLESLNTFLVHELGTYKVDITGVVNKAGVFYLKQTATSTIAEVNSNVSEMLVKLLHFTKTNKIATNGAPFTLYQTFSRTANTATYSVCIPIKEEIYTTPGSEIEGGKLEPFTALRTTLKGDYSHLKKAWDAAYKNIADKGLQENTTGQYLEVYTRSVAQTKKPSEWITDIYIPIGQPALPAETLPAASVPAATGTTTARPAAATNTRPATTTGTTQPRTTTPSKPAGTTAPSRRIPAASTAQPARTTPSPVTE
jgi:effector-binding domain-containing protein